MNIGQSKKQSLIETVCNIAIGSIVGMLSNYYILPLFGYNPSLATSLHITVWFTLVSVARSYTLRRIFNHYHVKGFAPLFNKLKGKFND